MRTSTQPEGETNDNIPDQHPIQPFKAQAFHNGKFIEVTEASLKGKWSVVIFMPADFTFNCPTEVEDAGRQLRRVPEGRRRDLHRHHRHPLRAQGVARDLAGRRQGQFPLVGDPTHALTRNFGVHIDEEGLALRGTFVINPEGVIKIARDPRQRDRPRRQGNRCASSRPRSTSPPTPARSARPSGMKAPRH